jgi:hypothetical protein
MGGSRRGVIFLRRVKALLWFQGKKMCAIS